MVVSSNSHQVRWLLLPFHYLRGLLILFEFNGFIEVINDVAGVVV